MHCGYFLPDCCFQGTLKNDAHFQRQLDLRYKGFTASKTLHPRTQCVKHNAPKIEAQLKPVGKRKDACTDFSVYSTHNPLDPWKQLLVSFCVEH